MGEMEVMIPSQTAIDFGFNNKMYSEDYYFSAPASPGQILQHNREFDDYIINNSMVSDVRRKSVCLAVPFDWEEKPGIPKSVVKMKNENKFEDEFAFDVSQEMDIDSLSADELFDGGKIRPHFPLFSTKTSLRSKKSSLGYKLTEEAEIRGRDRSVSSLSSSRSGHRASRSLSPLRVSEYPWEEEYRQQQQNQQQNSKQSSSTSLKAKLTSSVSSTQKGHKKWKLKDFFLFRSASEGRASDKVDPLKKYASLFSKHDDTKNSSFRSVEKSPGSSRRRRKGGVSAHELHYTVNRAVSEDLKRKTFLPYKQGILGRLAFNPALNAVANGFGFSRK